MFEENLKHYRHEKHLTQSQLAKLLGKSASTIGMYEQGKREPNQAVLCKLAEILGVTTDDLIYRNAAEPARPQEIDAFLEEIRKEMIHNKAGLMFNGVPLEIEDVEKVIEAMKIGVSIALKRNKGKVK